MILYLETRRVRLIFIFYAHLYTHITGYSENRIFFIQLLYGLGLSLSILPGHTINRYGWYIVGFSEIFLTVFFCSRRS